MADRVDHSHGDAGDKPAQDLNFQDGDYPDPETFDWFWSEVPEAINNHADRFERIDSDGDDQVDAADYADDAGNVQNSYKSNDIDSNGDGRVDAADQANTADALYDANAKHDIFQRFEGGTVPANDFVPLQTFGLDDSETLYVTQATLTEDGWNTPAPSGLDLVLSVVGETNPVATLVSGDGSTLYDDVEGTPIASYENTSGGHQTAVIAINNGDFGQTGVGSEQIGHGGFIARIV